MTERTIEREIEIAAPAEAVWKALTEARELERWFPTLAEVDRQRKTIRLAWGDAYDSTGAIEAWEEGRHLRHRFPMVEGVHLATDYRLEGRGGRTILRVVSSGFGSGSSWDEAYDGVSSGWDFELYALRHYLERHRGEDRRVVLLVRPLTGSPTAMWSSLTGPGGLFRDGLHLDGAVWRGTAAGGTALSGEVVSSGAPRHFAGRVREVNDGLFRIEIEAGDPGRVWVQLAGWNVEAAALDELAAAWEGVFAERLAV